MVTHWQAHITLITPRRGVHFDSYEREKWKYKPFDLWGGSLTCNLLCETWTRSYSVVSHHTAIERWKCIKSYRYTRLKICVCRFSMRRLITKTFLLHHVMNYDSNCKKVLFNTNVWLHLQFFGIRQISAIPKNKSVEMCSVSTLQARSISSIREGQGDPPPTHFFLRFTYKKLN